MADKNILTQRLSHNDRVTVHWVTQAAALVLITIGQAAIYSAKNQLEYPHFETNHGKAGLFLYIVTVFLSTLHGTATKYSYNLRKRVPPIKIKMVHAYAGSFAYVLAVITLLFGINQSWNEETDNQIKIGIIITLILTTFYVVSNAVEKATSRAKDLKSKSVK